MADDSEWDVTLCDQAQAKECEKFTPCATADELKERFNTFVGYAEAGDAVALGAVAFLYPDLAALMWVLEPWKKVETDGAALIFEGPPPGTCDNCGDCDGNCGCEGCTCKEPVEEPEALTQVDLGTPTGEPIRVVYEDPQLPQVDLNNPIYDANPQSPPDPPPEPGNGEDTEEDPDDNPYGPPETWGVVTPRHSSVLPWDKKAFVILMVSTGIFFSLLVGLAFWLGANYQ
jgi:hypothetical protein